jgi:hypothetical protein
MLSAFSFNNSLLYFFNSKKYFSFSLNYFIYLQTKKNALFNKHLATMRKLALLSIIAISFLACDMITDTKITEKTGLKLDKQKEEAKIEDNIPVNPNVTKFLGLPIDGSKSSIVEKLKEKGFSKYGNNLKGEFNGEIVELSVETQKDKVWRIVVLGNKVREERDIIVKFNDLMRQFEENSKYISHPDNKKISQQEDIDYEMNIRNKRYEAVFYQKDENGNKDNNRIVWFLITKEIIDYRITLFYENLLNDTSGSDL